MTRDFWIDAVFKLLTTVLLSTVCVRSFRTPTAVCPPIPPGPIEPVPIPPGPEQPDPPPKPDPINSILKIYLGRSMCTAVLIGHTPRAAGNSALTASHCVRGVGQTGKAIMKDGRELKISVVVVDRRSDCALLAIETDDILPFAVVAKNPPPKGTAVWHSGYGVDRPGNKENGHVVHPENRSGQTQFEISVSSGDSGGPIYNAKTGEVLSVVCCGGRGQVWGASCSSLRRLIRSQSWAPHGGNVLIGERLRAPPFTAEFRGIRRN